MKAARTKTQEVCDAEAKAAKAHKKAATEMKGRHNQPRGSAEHNTKPQYKKPFGRTGKTDWDENMTF